MNVDLQIKALSNSVSSITKQLDLVPKFEIKNVIMRAVESATVELDVAAKDMTQLYGVIQISATFAEYPAIQKSGTTSAKLTYSFGASTSGKHQCTFLLIGV